MYRWLIVFACWLGSGDGWLHWSVKYPEPDYNYTPYNDNMGYNISWMRPYPPLFSLALKFLSDAARFAQKELPDRRYPLDEYDFVIIGAGSAGSVLANRLSENPMWKILLIEAGEHENYIMDIPLTAHFLQFSFVNWKYKSLPSHFTFKGLEDGRLNIPRGKVMGGSSVLNAMVYMRGHPKDYDSWAAQGNPGWSWKDVLPYFKKSEDSRVPWKRVTEEGEDIPYESEYHNIGGYLTVSSIRHKTTTGKLLIEAGKELGLEMVDYNGKNMVGISPIQVTMKDGMRMSTNRAFLHPIRDRKNLHIIMKSHVTKLIFSQDGLEVKGVEYVRRGKTYSVRARKEVILSAGAIGSPHILMLSGIGPKNNLKNAGVKLVKKLPVGFNLMDHPMIFVSFTTNVTDSTTPMTLTENPYTTEAFLRYREGLYALPGGMEMIGLFDTKNGKSANGYPDIEIQFIQGTIASEPTLHKAFGIRRDIYRNVYQELEGKHGFSGFIFPTRPESRGRVFLNSSNPFDKPFIYTGLYEDNKDVDIMIKGIKQFIKVGETKALGKINSKFFDKPLPACSSLEMRSDEYWKCYLKQFTFTNYHQCGTCKMGPASDKTSVVDSRLRVHGIKKLRVVDASVMPIIPTAHLNAPVIMIAEKASDMIKEDWK